MRGEVSVNTHKSNEFMLKNHLLKNNAKTANFHSLIDLAESHSSRNQNFLIYIQKIIQ